MGERFYLQQLKAIGTCPGMKTSKRRTKVAWTDEKKQEAINMYEEANPTPETSIEIVQTIAEELEETVNGVRMVLSKAGVYIKKGAASGTKSSSKAGAKSGEGAKRVSKEDAITALRNAIAEAGQEADDEILGKLTGKAAIYFTGVITSLTK